MFGGWPKARLRDKRDAYDLAPPKDGDSGDLWSYGVASWELCNPLGELYIHPGKLTWNLNMEVEGRWLSFSIGWCLGSMVIFRGVCFNYFLIVLLIIWFTISILIWKCQWSNRKLRLCRIDLSRKSFIGICSRDWSHWPSLGAKVVSWHVDGRNIWFDTILHASQYPKISPRYWDSRTNFGMNKFQQLEWKIQKVMQLYMLTRDKSHRISTAGTSSCVPRAISMFIYIYIIFIFIHITVTFFWVSFSYLSPMCSTTVSYYSFPWYRGLSLHRFICRLCARSLEPASSTSKISKETQSTNTGWCTNRPPDVQTYLPPEIRPYLRA